MKELLCLMFMLIGSKSMQAQHCAFDGTHILVVHLTDNNGKSIQLDSIPFSIQEVENFDPSECSFANQFISKPFLPMKEVFLKDYNLSYNLWVEKQYKSWELFKPGYYAVLLNQSEYHCMKKNASNNYELTPRQFFIRYPQSNKTERVEVQRTAIYSLCTAAGDWRRIVPVALKISPSTKGQ